MEEKEALSQLRYLERSLSEVMARVTDRVIDEEVREAVERIAQDHSRQAGELNEALTAIGQAETQAPKLFRDHVDAVGREVVHARDQDGLFNGLADAEMLDLRMHEHMIAEGFPAQVQGVLEDQADEEREHLDFLQTRAPGMTPTIHGVRTVPKRGTVE